jgi:hypothetical protein
MKIPVTFEYEGKEYNGFLVSVPGAGNQMFHLMVNNYYKGQLFLTEQGWRFSSQNKKLEHLQNVFVEVLKKGLPD